MKNRIIILFFLLAGLCYTASGNPSFKVNGNEISTIVVSITFDGDNAVLNFSDGTQSSHDMSTLEILFPEISTLIESNSYILSQMVHDQLVIDNCAGNQLVCIFDMAGRLMHQMRSEEGMFSIDVNHMNAGVYILKIGNEAVRFIKQ